MPELVYSPANPLPWPPPQAKGRNVLTHKVKRLPPRPGRTEAHGPVEGFLDVCKEHRIEFPALIEFNFGLACRSERSADFPVPVSTTAATVFGEKHYFEKINWYLKHRLRCRKTTEKGNFIWEPGMEIFIPPGRMEVEPALIEVPRKSVAEVRWIRFAVRQENAELSYTIPGVDRTAEAIDSKLPGDTGLKDSNGQAIAALVNFVASTVTSRIAQVSAKRRLEHIEQGFLKGGAGVGDALQPRGPHQAVVVIVRKAKNKHDPSFPELPFGGPIIAGFGDVADVGKILERYRATPRLEAAPPDNVELSYDYYLGTRLSAVGTRP